MILRFGKNYPEIADTAFIAPDATVIGRVSIGERSSVWFQSVIRADVHWMRIGADCNIQDRSVLHVTTDTWPTILEDRVTVGHSVTLHGCTLRSGCLVGIGAIVMDGAEIGEGSLIGAGSLVTPNARIPAGVLAHGSPCRVQRRLTDTERLHIAAHADRYVDLSRSYLAQAKQDHSLLEVSEV